jgi:hypothetical protein
LRSAFLAVLANFQENRFAAVAVTGCCRSVSGSPLFRPHKQAGSLHPSRASGIALWISRITGIESAAGTKASAIKVLQAGNLGGGRDTAGACRMQEALALCYIPVTNWPTFRGNDKK